VLADSFLAQNPGSGFSILVVDGPPPGFGGDEPFEVLAPSDVGIDREELNRRATMYSAQGLVASMKPNLLLALLSRREDPLVLLDADGCVYDDLSPVAQAAERHSLVLSPHALDPHPLWSVDSPEQIILRAGVMNAGLVGVGSGGAGFLRWWAERTARRCVFDAERGLMLAQTWLTLATALFDHHVLRDRGCNVAGWNLQARDVAWDGDTPTIDGGPLRHFHFAGSFDPEQPHLLTTIAEHARWWPSLDERPGVALLASDYAARLIARGHQRARASEPRHHTMPGGTPIETWMRSGYRKALIDAERAGVEEPPNPFSHGEERFLGWVEQHAVAHLDGGPSEVEMPSGDRGELIEALLDRRQLLARIMELEGSRDDAVRWAERARGELLQVITEHDSRFAELSAELDRLAGEHERDKALMESVWRSPSWRMTRPLRQAKALAGRIARGHAAP
jgi:hypothetical protein